jgi:hypothetical protein
MVGNPGHPVEKPGVSENGKKVYFKFIKISGDDLSYKLNNLSHKVAMVL